MESNEKQEQKIAEFFTNSLKNKKIQIGLIIGLLLIIIIIGSWIRTQNINLLKDNTTGEHIPLALDPFYFLRTAHAIIDNGGTPPAHDVFRKPYEPAYTTELLPKVIILIHRIANSIGENITLNYADIIYPVIFFALGLFVFFFLILFLTKSKVSALLSSLILALIPSYLYRTLAGFADHESIGMFAFFLNLSIFAFGLKHLEKNKKNIKDSWIKISIIAIILGFSTMFTVASWGGVSKFSFMIIPSSFLLFWIINTKKTSSENTKVLLNYVLFYLLWITSTILSGVFFGRTISSIFNYFMLSFSGILGPFTLVFIFVDYFMIKYRDFFKNEKIGEYRIFVSAGISIIIGLIGLSFFGRSIKQLISDFFIRILNPFGIDRLGLTVAENKQPYLKDWIAQNGKVLFSVFMAGMLFVGVNISKGIRKYQNKILFVAAWFMFIFGLIFTRISASSIFNGENLISKFMYLTSFVFFIGVFIYIYFKDSIKIKSQLIIILSWLIVMVISARGALRLFFVITPFVCFMASYAIVNFYLYAKNSKEEISKYLFYGAAILSVILLTTNLMNFYDASLYQAKHTSPSANDQWQKAMKWTRENTPEGSIFSHWWDYGYWVEYLGKRPTIADGGHFEGTFRDHLIGRYILTTPKPEQVLSFEKSNNVSYLLIDQTDLGKYPAYSSIGSDANWDRVSSIGPMVSKPESIKETANTTIRVYQGGYGVGDDIVYENNGTEIFLPGAIFNDIGSPSYKSFIGGVILEKQNNADNFSQPIGVFIYNNNQYRLPLRYLYNDNDGNFIDFKKGIDAGIMIIPSISNSATNQNLRIDKWGAIIYLSPRTIHSTVAQLYLMNDPENKYKGISLAHTQANPIVENLRSGGYVSGDFVYYHGIQGPIKIFSIKPPANIIAHEEFLRRSGKWAEFDDLKFAENNSLLS